MPARYEGIKKSMRKRYPKAPLKEIKTRAAKIYEATKKPGEEHIQTAAARERRRKAPGVLHRALGGIGRMVQRTGAIPPPRAVSGSAMGLPGGMPGVSGALRTVDQGLTRIGDRLRHAVTRYAAGGKVKPATGAIRALADKLEEALGLDDEGGAAKLSAQLDKLAPGLAGQVTENFRKGGRVRK